MEPSEHAKALEGEAVRIIKVLLVVAEDAYAQRRPGKTLPAEVKDWWLKHYRSKFYFALDYEGRTYAQDRANLEESAKRLGEALAEGSDPPTEKDAVMAAWNIDCRDRAGILVKWCN